MKAISLSRPWPHTILHLGKRIENRKRRDGRMPPHCRHRGPLLLHAAKSWDKSAIAWMIERKLSGGLPALQSEHVGGGIGGLCRAIAHIDE